jgi:hypothetical protein
MNTPAFSLDDLFNVELRIARRADELARRRGSAPQHSLELWRQAESEIWSRTGQLMDEPKAESCDSRPEA